MARRVGELFGDKPRMRFKPESLRTVKPQDIWANYDVETDSLLVYVTGNPVRGVHVYLDNDISLIVSPADNSVVGFYIEAFERRFVPEHKEIAESWPQVKGTLEPDTGWSQVLRFLALWLAALISQIQSDRNLSLHVA